MSGKALGILIAIIIAMAGIAAIFSLEETGESTNGDRLLPGFEATLNDVDQITVRRAGDRVVATIVKGEDGWKVLEADGYPANLGRIRSVLITLAQARVLELKTAKPELYDRLGVEDISNKSASGTLLEIRQASGKTTSLIIGQTGVGGGQQSYVRRAGQGQSLMISGEPDVGTDLVDWLDRDLLNISSAQVRSVTVTDPDGETFRIEKPGPDATDFVLAEMPEGRELSFPGAANSLAAVLSDLRFDAVEPAFEPLPGERFISRFETVGDLVVTVTATRVEDGIRVRFAAESAADDAADRAAEINERLGGWAYTLPSYKSEQLTKTREDLLAPVQ